MKDFEGLLTTNTPEAQELARQLRKLIRTILPDSQERIYAGWGVADIYMGEPKGRGFMSIGPQKKYVNLYFMNGADLPDPAGLLTGTGKKLRHVKIMMVENLQNPALRELIEAAASR